VPLTLYVDGPRWRAHLDAQLAADGALVPVVKGNGYGFGHALLAAEAARMGVRVLAVGQPDEVASVRPAFAGDVLVLGPHLPGVDEPPEPAADVVRTASTPDGLRALAGHRVVVELASSMRRFGLTAEEVAAAADDLARIRHEGWSMHLPLESRGRGRLDEVSRAAQALPTGGGAARRLWVSHLSDAELQTLRDRHPRVTFLPRVGTRLWLGDRESAVARASVLAVHELRRGDRYGYYQRRAPRTGWLVVVAGGTSHGIAMEAPGAAAGGRQRVRSLATGGLEAVGRALSPYRVDGARRWFAEPPHMQVSMLWLPGVEQPPAVGSELDVDVRMTTTTPDQVLVS
jgi:hypothetical protein